MRSRLSHLLLAGLCVLACAGIVAPARAHELLPQALVEYIQEHPEATPAEIEAFVASDPELAGAGAERQRKLVELARNGPPGFWANVWGFLLLGVEHILSGPDHVLFVFSLLLTFVSFRKTAWLLSCFTLAHSTTIILAGAGWLRVSSSFVEPLIALSIAYVAITSVFLSKRYPFFADNRSKAAMVTAFGFFHGMGFAGALEEVAVPRGIVPFLSSLLSFNLGVDIGQMFVVVVALPVLLLCRRALWYRLAVTTCALVISALALLWFANRVLYL